MQDKFCIHCFVSGLVQGVCFRANTVTEAKALQLTGWVKNLPDGRVEVLACGEKVNVLKLYEWLQQGPVHARVSGVTLEELPAQHHSNFTAT
ncbi:MAG: acylphosphatase [Gammaproteobacteria bacterium]|nr:acylphosphatase [Gammaproteobacteria bacterium]